MSYGANKRKKQFFLEKVKNSECSTLLNLYWGFFGPKIIKFYKISSKKLYFLAINLILLTKLKKIVDYYKKISINSQIMKL